MTIINTPSPPGLAVAPRVATLPCKILMSQNQRRTETCFVINDKSQGSVAPCLSCGENFVYYFITH